MNKVVVIPADKLGVLEHHFRDTWALKLKSHRRAAFNRLARVLKDLGLIERALEVKGLASGLDSDGALQAFIICEIEQRHVGEVGPLLHNFMKSPVGTESKEVP